MSFGVTRPNAIAEQLACAWKVGGGSECSDTLPRIFGCSPI